MSDRWAILRDVAVDAESPQQVYWRWVDHLSKPINAREYRLGFDAFILYEDAEGRWVVQGASGKATRQPQRFFASEQEAAAILQGEGFAYARTWPVYAGAAAPAASKRWLSLGGWMLFGVLLVALLVALVAIVRLLSAPRP